MTNPAPLHVVKHINPGTGAASLVEVAAASLANHISSLRQSGIPDANIFVYAPASLEITTITSYTVNGTTI